MDPFGQRSYAPQELEAISDVLQQNLGPDHLAERAGAGNQRFTYVEGWKAIELANNILSFNGWSCSIIEITKDYVEERKDKKWTVGMTAVVRITLKDGSYHEEVGFGSSDHPRRGDAIEHAKKEAVTDARKRCLRLFGNALGNCIYNKKHLKTMKTPRAQNLITPDINEIRALASGQKRKAAAPPERVEQPPRTQPPPRDSLPQQKTPLPPTRPPLRSQPPPPSGVQRPPPVRAHNLPPTQHQPPPPVAQNHHQANHHPAPNPPNVKPQYPPRQPPPPNNPTTNHNNLPKPTYHSAPSPHRPATTPPSTTPTHGYHSAPSPQQPHQPQQPPQQQNTSTTSPSPPHPTTAAYGVSPPHPEVPVPQQQQHPNSSPPVNQGLSPPQPVGGAPNSSSPPVNDPVGAAVSVMSEADQHANDQEDLLAYEEVMQNYGQ